MSKPSDPPIDPCIKSVCTLRRLGCQQISYKTFTFHIFDYYFVNKIFIYLWINIWRLYYILIQRSSYGYQNSLKLTKTITSLKLVKNNSLQMLPPKSLKMYLCSNRSFFPFSSHQDNTAAQFLDKKFELSLFTSLTCKSRF